MFLFVISLLIFTIISFVHSFFPLPFIHSFSPPFPLPLCHSLYILVFTLVLYKMPYFCYPFQAFPSHLICFLFPSTRESHHLFHSISLSPLWPYYAYAPLPYLSHSLPCQPSCVSSNALAVLTFLFFFSETTFVHVFVAHLYNLKTFLLFVILFLFSVSSTFYIQ